MKTKTVKLIIDKKIEAWLKTINDKALREAIKENIFVSGGAIASMYLQQPVNDFDVYFTDPMIAEKVALYYINLFFDDYKGNFPKDHCWVFNNDNPKTSFGKQYCKMKNIPYTEYWDEVNGVPNKKFITDMNDVPVSEINKEHMAQVLGIYIKSAGAITITGTNYQYFETIDPDMADQFDFLKDLQHEGKKKVKGKSYFPTYITQNGIMLSDQIQLIFRFVGTPAFIHTLFDFVHATNYLYYEKTLSDKHVPKLVLNQKALECLLTKQLKYQNSKYPVAALCRVRKFLNRGFTISAGEILKISMQISNLDLKDPHVLYDQLMGVDMAYFFQLITAMENAKKNPVYINVDATYIAELIDNIFG